LDRHDWSRLNRLQLGKYAEYLVKMEFVLCGGDVFASEVDDHGIDFVIRTRQGNRYDVQVKSFRIEAGKGTPYVFLQKSKFNVHPSLMLALVQFVRGGRRSCTCCHLASGTTLIPSSRAGITETGRRVCQMGIDALEEAG
jgi:hypothetical protein